MIHDLELRRGFFLSSSPLPGSAVAIRRKRRNSAGHLHLKHLCFIYLGAGDHASELAHRHLQLKIFNYLLQHGIAFQHNYVCVYKLLRGGKLA